MHLKSPLYAQFELTYGCNLSCAHCLNDPRYDSSSNLVQIKRERVDLKRVERIAERIADWHVFSATLTGGEPLTVKRRLFTALRTLREKGITVDMNSNLAMMTQDVAKELSSEGLSAVLTSIASYDSETHDRKMGVIGSLPRTLAGARHAKSAGLYVSSNMVVAKDNYTHVYETGKMVSEQGIDAFCISPITPSRSGCAVQLPLVLDEEQMLSALEQLADVEDEFGIRTRLLQPLPHCFLNEHPRLRKYMNGGCDAGDGYITIDPRGTVKPCAQIPDGFGNVLEDDINLIWERMHPYHTGANVPIACAGCDAVDSCSGGCRAESERRVGTLASPHPFMKGALQLEKLRPRSIELLGTQLSVAKDLREREESAGIHIVKGRATNYTVVNDGTLTMLRDIESRGHVLVTNDLADDPEFCMAATVLLDNNVLIREDQNLVNTERNMPGLALMQASTDSIGSKGVKPALMCECYEIDPGCFTPAEGKRYAPRKIHYE